MFSMVCKVARQCLSAAQGQCLQWRCIFSHKLCGVLFICVTVLALDNAIIPLPFSRSDRFMVDGLCLAVLAVVGIWALVRYNRKHQQKPRVAPTFVWARLTYTEASSWSQCGKDQKPPVNFEKHQITSSGDRP